MDPERWRRVQELFDAALERAPAERPAFLAQACGGDAALRAEVEDLLLSDLEAAPFFDDLLCQGAASVAADPLLAQGRIGKYEILFRIGEGGFGVVYRGRDPVLRRDVAVKTCSTHGEKLRRRFFREAQIAARLHHPNITTIYDFGLEGDVPYLVQEFLEGEDLSAVIARASQGVRPSLAERLGLLLQIASGLEHAHAQGVLHRDIKPANVRVLPGGTAKILDFGIAKLLHEGTELTSQGVALGTIGYLAPEVLRGEPVDHRADVFSFGVLAYELLTGARPFPGSTFPEVSHRLLTAEPRPLRERCPECGPEAEALITGCLAKSPAFRVPGFGPVVAALEAELGLRERVHTPLLTHPSMPPAPEPPRRLAGAAVAAALLVIAGLAAGWVVRRGDDVPREPPAAVAPLQKSEPEAPAFLSPSTEPEKVASAAPEPAPETAAEKRTEPPPPARVERTSREPERSLPPAPAPSPSDPPPALPPVSNDPAQPVQSAPAQPEPEVEAPAAASDPVPEDAPAPMSRGGLIHSGPGVTEPRLLRRPDPEYPALARQRRVQARVVVAVLVDEEGRVIQTTIKQSDDPGLGFKEAARAAARQAVFAPPTRDGIPGKMWTELPFEFKVE